MKKIFLRNVVIVLMWCSLMFTIILAFIFIQAEKYFQEIELFNIQSIIAVYMGQANRNMDNYLNTGNEEYFQGLSNKDTMEIYLDTIY